MKSWVMSIIFMAASTAALPALSVELMPAKVRGFDQAQVLAKETWPRFNAIYLAPSQLAFNHQWLKGPGRKLSSSERSTLQAQYEGLFNQKLRQRLTEDGWPISAEPGPGTLTIATRVSDFFLNAPDLEPTISKSYVRVAGFARVEFTLLNTEGKPLASLSDYSQTNEKPGGQLGLTNRGLNRWDFGHLMQCWATRLGEFLPPPTSG